MHVASETSKEEVAHARHFPAVEWALRDLTANLMRVAAGAGSSYLISRQVVTVLEAFRDYGEAAGVMPSYWHLDHAFDAARGHDLYERSIDDRWHHLAAEQHIVVGALRMAASRLVCQQAQERAGEGRMYQGLNEVFDLRKKRDEKWVAEQKASTPARRKPAKKSAPKRKLKASNTV